MSKTLEEIKADALELPGRDRDQLIEELLEASAEDAVSLDHGWIEATLAERMRGPFRKVDELASEFAERRKRHVGVLKRVHG